MECHFKICQKCFEQKEIKLFNNCSKSPDNKQGYCRSCCKEVSKIWRTENKEYHLSCVKLWVNNNRDKVNLTSRKSYRVHHKKRLLDKQIYHEKNKEKHKLEFKIYDKNNREKRKAIGAKYRATKLQATPKWLTKQQLKEIENFYTNCPKGYHVDHIIPLQGKEVNGLHVLWNLQYLSREDNLKKSNKLYA